MVIEISIEEVFNLNLPVIDVRSPGEYEKGNLPNSINIPLFSNDERAHVGTVYKQISREEAIRVGYTYVNPKLDFFIEKSKAIAPSLQVIIHCWRGGMRSRSFAQHLSDNGFEKVYLISGGYKAFRNHVLNTFAAPVKLNVLGGFTGSGKTHILKHLKDFGYQVIDLEGLANHKGSAFGAIGEKMQPTVEQFENNLFEQWCKLDFAQPIWVEDESFAIGSVNIPMPLFCQIRNAKLYFIEIPKEERAKHLVTEYTQCDNQLLKDSLLRISKRLGGQHVSEALQQLENNNYYEVALIALTYYDKSYQRCLTDNQSRTSVKLPLRNTNHYENAKAIEIYIQENERNQIDSI